MIEILAIVILALAYGYEKYMNAKERKTLINAILSKNIQEFKEVEQKPQPVKEQVAPDLIPMDEVDDNRFNQLIQQQLNKDNG